MASTLTVQIGSQANGTHGSYLVSKQLHRNIWRAVEGLLFITPVGSLF